MNLRQLEFFVCIAEEESFTKAAKKLFVSQPNISKSIRQLELELGVELFNRKSRKSTLNRYGQYFYDEIKEILHSLENTERTIKEMVNPFLGTVNLSFIHTLGNTLIPQIIGEYHTQFPDVKFNLLQSSTDVLLDDLLAGGADFCFLMDREFPEGIEYTRLFTEKLYVILPKYHSLAHLKEIDLIDLKNESFINFKPGIGLRNSIDLICHEAGFEPKNIFECQEVGTVAGFVEAGLGVSLIPDVKGIKHYEIVMLPLTNEVHLRNINLAMRNNVFKAPAVEQFHKFLKKKFEI